MRRGGTLAGRALSVSMTCCVICVCPGFCENSSSYSSTTCLNAGWISLGKSSWLGLVLLDGKAYGNSSSMIK